MITNMTFIFPYHLASYLKMTHTQSPPGNQSERNTSCVDSLISNKPDSKKERERDRYMYICMCI